MVITNMFRKDHQSHPNDRHNIKWKAEIHIRRILHVENDERYSPRSQQTPNNVKGYNTTNH